jgi:hypothetical protein
MLGDSMIILSPTLKTGHLPVFPLQLLKVYNSLSTKSPPCIISTSRGRYKREYIMPLDQKVTLKKHCWKTLVFEDEEIINS